MDDLVIWGFVFPLVLAFGLACFWLGYTTPRAAKPKTKPEQLLEPEPAPTLETWQPVVVDTASDSFTRPEVPPT